LILDVEKVLAEITDRSEEEIYGGIETSVVTSGKHALVADDSLVARKQISKTLERMGMTFEEVSTGREALVRAKDIADQAEFEGRPLEEVLQLILTDIEMPEMDGFTFAKQLREDFRFVNIPILMHSSLSGKCNIAKGRAVGVTDYVTKFDARHLREVIHRVFSNRS